MYLLVHTILIKAVLYGVSCVYPSFANIKPNLLRNAPFSSHLKHIEKNIKMDSL